MPHPLRAVIFDMDGLLFDTEELGRWAWSKALAERGYTLTDDLYRTFVGRDLRARLELLRRHFGPDCPTEELKDRRLAIGDERELADGVTPKPGAVALVRALHERGLPLALATGTARVRAERRLARAGIDHCFSALVPSDEVARGKPAPDIFLEAARRLGVPAQHCLVFEDASAGVRAALDAGARVVWVRDMEDLPPDLLARCQRLESLEHAPARFSEWFG